MNHIPIALRWILLVVTMLFALSWLPDFTVGKMAFRKISVVSDLLLPPTIDSSTLAQADTIQNRADTTLIDTLPIVNTQVAREIICPKGSVCIEDFSEKQNALGHFAEAIALLQQKKRTKVRIAWFGDSFVEGDMITGALRDSLQRDYGGEGVGFVPITSPVAKLRPTIGHTFSNWKTYSILDKSAQTVPFGFSGLTFVPLGTATVGYSGVNFAGGADVFSSVRFFYSHAQTGASVAVSLDKAAAENAALTADTTKLHQLKIAALGSTNIDATFKGKMRLYGASMEADHGIYIDNFALRGNAGQQLKRIDKQMLTQIQSLQNYDLVVIQYGLNVTFSTLKDYAFYENEMLPVVQDIQKCFPKSAILMLGTSDRGTHDERGNLVSYTGIASLTAAQRNIATTCGIAFWDTRKAMNSTGGLAAWHTRGHSASDYTHLSWAGGKRMANLLYQALSNAIVGYQ
jgi:lysophospholipase L1-like esterase